MATKRKTKKLLTRTKKKVVTKPAQIRKVPSKKPTRTKAGRFSSIKGKRTKVTKVSKPIKKRALTAKKEPSMLALKKGARKFKPSKKLWGTSVLVDEKGKQLKKAGTGIPVYINLTGSKHPVGMQVKNLTDEETKRLELEIKQAKGELEAKAIEKKFKPKPNELDSFVFVGLDGQRLAKSSKRKGWFLYVSKKGKVSLAKPKFKSSFIPSPKHVGSWNLADVGKPEAFKKYVGSRQQKLMVEPKMLKGDNIPFEKLTTRIAKDIKELHKRNLVNDLIISVNATIEYDDGKLRTHNVRVNFKQAEQQQLTGAFYKSWLDKKLYAEFAEALADQQLVSQGSADTVSRYPWNKGRSKSKWRDRRNLEPWTKRSYAVVQIRQFDWMLSRIVKEG